LRKVIPCLTELPEVVRISGYKIFVISCCHAVQIIKGIFHNLYGTGIMSDYGFDKPIEIIQMNNSVYTDNTNQNDNQKIVDDQSVENCKFQRPVPLLQQTNSSIIIFKLISK
jgi:hypothetical protein